jgi:hypothetical protein
MLTPTVESQSAFHPWSSVPLHRLRPLDLRRITLRLSPDRFSCLPLNECPTLHAYLSFPLLAGLLPQPSSLQGKVLTPRLTAVRAGNLRGLTPQLRKTLHATYLFLEGLVRLCNHTTPVLLHSDVQCPGYEAGALYLQALITVTQINMAETDGYRRRSGGGKNQFTRLRLRAVSPGFHSR